MSQVKTYVLGGYQTDFVRNWSKENKHLMAMYQEAVEGAMKEVGIQPEEIEVAHVLSLIHI